MVEKKGWGLVDRDSDLGFLIEMFFWQTRHTFHLWCRTRIGLADP
jgi:hypothetical protein